MRIMGILPRATVALAALGFLGFSSHGAKADLVYNLTIDSCSTACQTGGITPFGTVTISQAGSAGSYIDTFNVQMNSPTYVFNGNGNGFDAFATAIASASAGVGQRPLRVTSPNAFASRWLVPRLPRWREQHPNTPLEIIGTDAVLDLRAGNADVAIRYARRMPPDLAAQEIFRDTFFPVCSPELLAKGTRRIERAADLLQYPLIHFDWMNRDPEAPMAGDRALGRSGYPGYQQSMGPELSRRATCD